MTNAIKYDSYAEPRPSFPYVYLDVANPDNEKLYETAKGKIDTGSHMTVIPKHMVESLDLKAVTTVDVRGFNNKGEEHYVYYVNINIGEQTYKDVRIIAPHARGNVLLGRDVINLWKMTLDGQNLMGEFTSLSTNIEDAK